jgi:hypothetical protein
VTDTDFETAFAQLLLDTLRHDLALAEAADFEAMILRQERDTQ